MNKLEKFIKICLDIASIILIISIAIAIFACILAKVYWGVGLLCIIMCICIYTKKRG